MHPEHSATPPIRIMLVDDHPSVRQGLALLLAPEGVAVCAEASDLAGALNQLEQCRPDLALVDLALADEDGVEVVAALHARALPSLVYSMHEDGSHIRDAFAAGALGYVTKRELHRVLVDAIMEVAAGRRFVSPTAASALAEHLAGAQAHQADCELSEQERQVYRLLGRGEGTIEIGAALKISTRTVESYYARIQDKLGLRGMQELRRHAIGHARK
ncbi:MAG: response regulator transcription factor [Candidatus Sumerlaeia bacterium]